MKEGSTGLGEHVGRAGVGGGMPPAGADSHSPANGAGRGFADAVPGFDDAVPGDRIDHSAGTFSGGEQKATRIPGGGRAGT